MTNPIRVKSLFSAAEYNSLADASDAAKESANGCEKINGRIVTGYRFNGNLLAIEFDNGFYLVVSPGSSSIKWDIVADKPQIDGQLDDYEIQFEFAKIGKLIWDWKNILDRFVGKQTFISPSDQYLFIYTKGGKEYMFSSLVNRDAPNYTYLFFSET